MKCIAITCIAFCALTLLCVFRISGKLDAISRGQPAQAVIVPSASPSAAAIAREIRKQAAEEAAADAAREARLSGRPVFSFNGVAQGRPPNASATGELFIASINIVRAGGFAGEVTLKSTPPVLVKTFKRAFNGKDEDHYVVLFEPERPVGNRSGFVYMPPRWPFTMAYTRKDGTAETRKFVATYDPNEKPPEGRPTLVQVTEEN